MKKSFKDYDQIIGPDGNIYDPKQISSTIDYVISVICLDKPVMATYFSALPLVYTFNIPTAATDGKFLFINPGFTKKIQDAVGLGGICYFLIHEIYHNIFYHIPRMNLHPEKYSGKMKECNIAMDYEINLALEIENSDLSGLGEKLGFLINSKYDGMTWEEIYDYILEHGDEKAEKMKQQSNNFSNTPAPIVASPDFKQGFRDGWDKAIAEYNQNHKISEKLNETYDEGFETYDEGFAKGYETAIKKLKENDNINNNINNNDENDSSDFPVDKLTPLPNESNKTKEIKKNSQNKNQNFGNNDGKDKKNDENSEFNNEGKSNGLYDGNNELPDFSDLIQPNIGDDIANKSENVEKDLHTKNDPFDLRNPANFDRLKNGVLYKSSKSGPGKGINELLAKIQKSLKPIINWKREILRLMKGYFNKQEIRGFKSKYIFQGRYIYQDRKTDESMNRLIVCIDTSGSIYGSKDALERFSAEISKLAAQSGAKKIDLLYFSDGVYKHIETKVNALITGIPEPTSSGGTDQSLVIKYIDENFVDKGKKFNCVVFFTDTDLYYVKMPTHIKYSNKIIWAIINASEKKYDNMPYGKTIFIDDEIFKNSLNY